MAYPVAFVLGFAYFLAATALITIFQENLADTERAVVMPLWFMSFGGSIPIGNLIFGPVIDAIGARWVLGFGAVVAVFLAWWCDLRRMPAGELPGARGGRPGGRRELRQAVRTRRARRRDVRGRRRDWP